MALTDMAVFWSFSTSIAAAEGIALFPAVVLGAFFAAGVIAFAVALTATTFTAVTMGEVVGLDFAKGIKTSSGHERRAKQHSIRSQQTCAWRVEKFKDQGGKNGKNKGKHCNSKWLPVFFWQARWANIWNAVLAGNWPSHEEFPSMKGGRCRRCCCRACAETWIIP